MKPYMEGPWEQRLSLEQPVLVLSQNCIYSVPLPAPPVTTTHCSQSLPRTAEGPGCADRGCRTSVETTRLCHSWETSLEAGGHSVPSPAQIHGQEPASAQVPEQCHVGRIPAKALIRDHRSILEPEKSVLVTQRREEKFRLLCSPSGFLAPLNLHNSPSAVPWGQWDPCGSRAPCGSRRFLRSAPALALAHANNCTNGSLPARGGCRVPALGPQPGLVPIPSASWGLQAQPECLALRGGSVTLRAAIGAVASL